MTTGKTIAMTTQTFVRKVMSLLFNTLSRFVIVFLPKGKCLLISWLQSLSTVILEPRKIKCHCFYIFPFYLAWSGGTGCHNLSFFLMLSFKPAFSLSSFILRWHSDKEFACECRRHGFNPWVWKIPCRKKWEPTPVFLPGKLHGQRRLAGCSPWGWRVRHDWEYTCTHFHPHQEVL